MPEPRLLLGSSAILALMFQEPGRDVVVAALDGAALSAVNLTEVMEIAGRRRADPLRAAGWVSELSIPVLPYTTAMATRAGALLAAFRREGMSLGDAACIGTAEVVGVPVLTGDRAWSRWQLPVEVRLLR